MWLNDIKPKGGILDGLRAGRRNLDGSDNFFPSNLIHTKNALHKSAGRFSRLKYVKFWNNIKLWCVKKVCVEEEQYV